MNEIRRAQVKEAQTHLMQAKVILDQVAADEQEAFDNLPESLQSAEQGMNMEAAVGILEEASNTCDNLDNELADL